MSNEIKKDVVWYSNEASIIERLVNVLPYPSDLRGLEILGDSHIKFTWRDITFCIKESAVTQITGQTELGSDLAILLRALLTANGIYLNRST